MSLRKSRNWYQHQSKSRQGAILILGAFLMIVFCGFAAFAIDLGYIALTAAQLQNTADASALAAVLELKDADPNATQGELRAAAVEEAIYAASLNRAGGRFVELYEQDVLFGNRHFDSGNFTTDWEGGYDPITGEVLPGDVGELPLNAIQVNIRYDQQTGQRRELDLWFARLIGHKTAIVSGFSRSHLTPRDLCFVIDISNSMNDDSENFSGRDDIIRELLAYPGGDYPGYNGGSAQNEPLLEFDLYYRGSSSNDAAGTMVGTTLVTQNLQALDQNLVSPNPLRFSTVNSVLVNSTAHGLADGDVVTVYNSNDSGVVNNRGYFVKRFDDNNFFLLGATKTNTANDGIRWYPEAAYPSIGEWGRMRVRCNHAHGLNDNVQIRVVSCNMDGNDDAEGYSYVKVVDGERLDLIDRPTNIANWGVGGNGNSLLDNLHRCYDNQRHYYRLEEWGAWQGPYKLLWLRCLDLDGPEIRGRGTNDGNMWISAEKAEMFAELEFASNAFDNVYPDPANYNHPEYYNNGNTGPKYLYGKGHPWNHWKWKTYCDWTYIDPDNTLYQNRNVISANASGPDRFGLQRYMQFCLPNGYLPALRGQLVFGRDMDEDGALDTFPPPDQGGETYSDYPDYAGFYTKPAYQANYSSAGIDFSEGATNAGLHPDNLSDQPFTFVRQATLLGIAAMVSDENAGNDAFDQVAFITYGTRAFGEIGLSNDLNYALKMANNRLAVTGSNMNISPLGNGNTNIGGAIRMALDVLYESAESRAFTDKTIALLTDGNPNISPQGGFTAQEYDPDTKTDSVINGTTAGYNYAIYWAGEAADRECVIHTITVGNGANTGLMQEIADMTGGFYFRVDDPAAQQQTLNDIFIAIGKDKLGKLFLN